jgi:antitoxin (DNA-binding transcriptional repressor) of toxin-antitoxin stability system
VERGEIVAITRRGRRVARYHPRVRSASLSRTSTRCNGSHSIDSQTGKTNLHRTNHCR